MRPGFYAVCVNGQPTTLKLSPQGKQKLVAAAVWGLLILVEDRDVATPYSRHQIGQEVHAVITEKKVFQSED